MAGLRLYTSNRLEVLADRLAGVLASPLASPLSPEIVVVQSKGMERWVRMELARRLGVCANVRFPFPNALLSELFRENLGGLEEDPVYDPEVMTWKILALLQTLHDKPGFEEIRRYLGAQVGGLRAFQLSREIARLLDQYLVFRPEMILSWESGRDGHWQARIWRALVDGHKARHRAAMRVDLLKTLHERPPGEARVPERISIFGISALPPFHLETFSALSRHADVFLFLMNPCREYWGDILSDREMQKGAGGGLKDAPSRDLLHLERGNPLLASMGTLGRDFFDLVGSLSLDTTEDFRDPGEDTLLYSIQHDILALVDPGDPGAVARRELRPEDRSILIHSCHSPMREIEVLKDQLLALFDEDPDLHPQEIIVMAPDIGLYAPLVESVFGDPAAVEARIPFAVADRGLPTETRTAETFMALLDLRAKRLTSTQVLSILEDPAVLRRFGLHERDLPRIARWVRDAGIRWGRDETHRAGYGMPPTAENTWRFGLERLLLGQALPGQDERLFHGILPYDHIEGTEIEILGRLTEFVEALFSQVEAWQTGRDLGAWAWILSEALDRFFLPADRGETELLEIRQALHALRKARDRSGFEEPVDLSVVQAFLTHRLQRKASGTGFLTGGVTFCSMLPMRSIPFKVICLIGMNGDAYPRPGRRLGFDLMAESPRPGDRSRRNDDRYLFLEALLSARKAIHISYVGQGVQDNAPIPPSVLVSELVDYLDQYFITASGRPASEQVKRPHRLQPFSPAYFRGDPGLISYSRCDFDGAQKSLGLRAGPGPFVPGDLPGPAPVPARLALSELQAFFSNPARYLLRSRLGIFLEETSTPLEETEPFVLEGLERYQLDRMLVESDLHGKDIRELHKPLRAAGRLPLGSVGEAVFYGEMEAISRFTSKLRRLLEEVPEVPLDLSGNIGGALVHGRLWGLSSQGLIRYRYAKIKGKDHVAAWIEHLFLNAFAPEGASRRTFLIGSDETWVFGPVSEAATVLKELLGIFHRGAQSPLAFFPESSMAFAVRVLEKREGPEEALNAAWRMWHGDEFLRGEGADPYMDLCFRHAEPLGAAFRETALKVLGPLLQARRKGT